ncbi:MAG: sulfur carrier protein ThiS [Cocleimonas sp.]
MIHVSINNSLETLDLDCTVLKALELLGYEKTGMLGVAINQTFVPKDQWADTILNDQDKVDILNPVSGG